MDFRSIAAKISSLQGDRLQKLVDIIEEEKEWFNITKEKFEFDLQRLSENTLIKIKRCLQHWRPLLFLDI